MKRTILALVVTFILLPSPVVSLHGLTNPVEPPALPRVETGYPILDTRIEAAREAGQTAIDALFDGAGDTLETAWGPTAAGRITLYADGTPDDYMVPTGASDARRGHLGTWTTIGTEGWRPHAEANRTGGLGHWFGNASGFAAHATAALVTPELDLRLGNTFDGVTVARMEVNGIEVSPERTVGQVEAPLRSTRSVDEDSLHFFEFHYRQNVGLAGDRLRVLALPEAPETLADLTCGQGCLSWTLPAGDDVTRWSRAVVDLDAFAEDRAWIAFVFESGAHVPADFVAFDHTSYYGVQIDDVLLQAVPAPKNIQVRELATPEIGAVVDRDSDIVVRGFVRNTGAVSSTVSTTVSVVAAKAGITRAATLPDTALGPGELQRIQVSLPALGIDERSVSAMIDAVTLDREPQSHSGDDSAMATFDVLRSTDFVMGDLVPSAKWVDIDEPIDVTIPVTNRGSIRQETTFRANVVDIHDPTRTVDHLLLSPPEQHVSLAVGESVDLSWGVAAHTKGQYRLLVRGDDAPDYSSADLTPSVEPQFTSAFVPNAAINVLDGIMDEPDWELATTGSMRFAGIGGDRAVDVRILNANDALYIGWIVPDGDDDAGGDRADDKILEVFFDDKADTTLLSGEWGLRLNGTRGTVAAPVLDVESLRYDSGSRWWRSEAAAATLAGRTYDEGAEEFSIELRLPLNGTSMQGLMAAPGEDIRLVARWSDRSGAHEQFPAEAVMQDGQGLPLANGRLDDESTTWSTLRTAPPVAKNADIRVSPGFGIGTGPPPLWAIDFTEGCEVVAGFQSGDNLNDGRTGFRVRYNNAVVGTDTWNCGVYEPEGKILMFEGLRADEGATCDALPCPQYSARESTVGPPVYRSTLTTPPIEIAADDPFLHIRHQYATAVYLRDPEDGGQSNNDIVVVGIGWVTADDVATPDVDENIYLVPLGGYDTEGSVGLRDPRFGANGRDFRDVFLPGPGSVAYCDEIGEAHNDGFERAPSPNCGWWWPTGRQGNYKPPWDQFPIGADFKGSPWKNDVIALVGDHAIQVDGDGGDSGLTMVDLRGRTVRFTFHYIQASDALTHPLDPTVDPPMDLGWRIESIAITDGQELVRDVAMVDAALDLPYDPHAIGLGPNTTITAKATLMNAGLLRQDLVEAVLECRDADVPESEPFPAAIESLPNGLEPDERGELRLSCNVPATAERVTFEARLLSADDLALNDAARIPGIFEVRASPDASVYVDVLPRRGSAGFARPTTVDIANTGNVPIGGFDVSLLLSKEGATIWDGVWHLDGRLEIGDRFPLTDPGLAARAADGGPIDFADLFIELVDTGAYSVTARTFLDADTDRTNDVAKVRIDALDRAYADQFVGVPEIGLPGLVTGEAHLSGHDLWALDDSRLVLGSQDGAIPPNSDASYHLPRMQLASAEIATVTMRHRYDFEDGYDGGRLELRAGDGDWQSVRPRATADQPSGYPDIRLESSALLDEDAAQDAGAFTGSSRDAMGSDAEGWIVSEFDLTKLPYLQSHKRFAEFPLQDLDLYPTMQFLDDAGDRYYAAENWNGWLVDNITENDPKPHSGDRMWWSGSPDHFDHLQARTVNTGLDMHLDLRHPRSVDEVVAVTFWDWRAGWMVAGELDGRAGTGGIFRVFAIDAYGQATQLYPRLLQKEATGWTQREVTVPPALLGQNITLQFHYVADPAALAETRTKNNDGWFIDDITAKSYISRNGLLTSEKLLSGPDRFDELDLSDCGGPLAVTTGGGTRFEADHRHPGSSACWSIVSRGPARPGGWHVERVDGPDHEDVAAWSIAADNSQGYDHQVNSRLVTPSIDLGRVVGNQAELLFDHRFGLEDRVLYDVVQQSIDAGIVEIQVFDSVSGRYGPWQQLPKDSFARSVIWSAFSDADNLPDRVLDDAGLVASGYSTMSLNGFIMPFGGLTEEDRVWLGFGAPMPSFDGTCRGCGKAGRDYQLHPIGYAFSGDSSGPGATDNGWQTASFNVSRYIGEKIRFAFHAWSNPTCDMAECEPSNGQGLLGWEITNVRLEGTVFAPGSAPLELRLRAATDSSVLDGSWEIDYVDVAASIYARNVALRYADSRNVFSSSETPARTIVVENLGTSPRSSLGVSVRATDADGAPIEARLVGLPVVSNDTVDHPRPGQVVYGPFGLNAAGFPQNNLSWAIEIVEAAPAVQIEVAILEDTGTDHIDENGTLVHTAKYGTPRDAVLANTHLEDLWTVTDVVRAEWSIQDNGLPFTVVGGGPVRDGNLSLLGTLHSTGSLAISSTLRWQATDITTGATFGPWTRSVAVPVGGSTEVELRMTDLPKGLYRIQVAADGVLSSDGSIDVPVGRSEMTWAEDFTLPSGAQRGDSIMPPGWTRADEYPGNEFSIGRIPGWLSWGTDPFRPIGYCGGRCRNDALDYAVTPDIDLSGTLNGQARLSLQHAFFFRPREGAQVQAAIIEGGVPVTCNSLDIPSPWVPLTPTRGYVHDAFTDRRSSPERPMANSLGDSVPIFQGPAGDVSQPIPTHYDLSGATWCPGGADARPYADATIRLRFAIGIDRNFADFLNRPGWQIDSVAVGSGGVDVGPSVDGVRDIQITRNAPKILTFAIRNTGIAEDTYDLTLLPQGDLIGQDLSLSHDQITLAGGEQRLVRVAVATTEALTTGIHAFEISARSAGDPLISQIVKARLDFQALAKPDLLVELDDMKESVMEGDIATIHAVVRNVGEVRSKGTTVSFEALDRFGQRAPIGTAKIAPLCSVAECGIGGSFTVATIEWVAPNKAEVYTIVARVDPERAQLDLQPDNNEARMAIRVVPVQLPDLEVDALEVIGADGRFVEAGSIVTVRATVRNVGQTSSSGGTLHVLAGSSTMAEVPLPLIVPGSHVVVEASKVVPAIDGRLEFRALVIPHGPELRPDNNEAQISLAVRKHDVSLLSVTKSASLPGGRTMLLFNATNHGAALERLRLDVESLDGWPVEVLTPQLVMPPQGSVTGIAILRVPANAPEGDTVVRATLATNTRELAKADAIVAVVARLHPASMAMPQTPVPTGSQDILLSLASSSNVLQTVEVHDSLGWMAPQRTDLGAFVSKNWTIAMDIPRDTPPGTVLNRLTLRALDGTWTTVTEAPFAVKATVHVDADWVKIVSLGGQGNGTRGMLATAELVSLSNVPVRVTGSATTDVGTYTAVPPPLMLEPSGREDWGLRIFVDERLRRPTGHVRLLLDGADELVTLALPIPDLSRLPDLTIRQFHVERDKADVVFRLLVRNEGNVTSGATNAHIFANGDLVAVLPVEAIEAGQGVHLTGKWRDAAAGPWSLVAIVDGPRQVLELHEDNNGASMDFTSDLPLSQRVPSPIGLVVLLAATLWWRRRP